MKVLLTGATGFVGSALTRRLESAGHVVLPVSRRPGARYDWSDDGLERGVREADAVVHLAGENLFDKRWTRRQKQILGLEPRRRHTPPCGARRRAAAFLPHQRVGGRLLRRQRAGPVR